MKHIALIDHGVVYRNPRPGHQAVSAFYSNSVPISDQEIVCCTRLGQALYSLDQRLLIQRSTDGGKTWNNEALVRELDKDSPQYSYVIGLISLFSDGSLTLVAHRRPASEKDPVFYDADTGALIHEEYCLFRSQDKGKTWSPPESLSCVEPEADLPSPIVELQDGRWFLPCSIWKAGSSGLHIKGYGFVSEDKGRNWTDRVDFPSAADKKKMYSHGRYTRMKDGRLCVLQWCQAVGGQENYDLHIEFADPTGQNWTTPQDTMIPGQSSWIGDLGGGLMVATYTFRKGPKPGIKVVLSRDGGKTWDLDNQVQVWDATGREYLGVIHPPKYPASHDNVAYGMPATTILPSGIILVQWWCTEACITQSRYARLRVE